MLAGIGKGWSPGETLGNWNFSYRRISAVKQCKPLRSSQSKNLNIFDFLRISLGDQPLTKEPEDSCCGLMLWKVLKWSKRQICLTRCFLFETCWSSFTPCLSVIYRKQCKTSGATEFNTRYCYKQPNDFLWLIKGHINVALFCTIASF